MKTAISVEDELFQEADRTARKMGVSRSRFFSLALEGYLREHRQRELLEQLNQVYDGRADPMAPKIKAKFRRVIQDKW
jgi:metal-responsive CopG/Arc/MetJ family transcriptional regulator